MARIFKQPDRPRPFEFGPSEEHAELRGVERPDGMQRPECPEPDDFRGGARRELGELAPCPVRDISAGRAVGEAMAAFGQGSRESTTTNEQKDIATKGTLHVAQATAPDVCKVPSMQMAPMPFPNYVTSTKLTKGATTKSFIASFPVWTSIGELGPPSEPAHFGTGGGVTSGRPEKAAS